MARKVERPLEKLVDRMYQLDRDADAIEAGDDPMEVIEENFKEVTK